MPQLVEMDRHVSLFEQMDEQVGSVILINTFTVEPEEADQLQEAWASDAAFMKQQPGFISTQLHRGSVSPPGEEGSGARNLRRVSSPS
jgi:hypothetical protein